MAYVNHTESDINVYLFWFIDSFNRQINAFEKQDD